MCIRDRVHPERGFVLHDGEREWDSSLPIGEQLYVTTSRDVLEAMARGDGPRHVTVALGCAGWGAGQLESELVENSWITAPADPRLLFALPLGARWEAAAGSIGVDMSRMADYSGHARAGHPAVRPGHRHPPRRDGARLRRRHAPYR